MSARRIRCRFCWRYHETDVGSFLGHVICPEAGEPTHHGQQPLHCHRCANPATAGHRGQGGRPACEAHRVERPGEEVLSFQHPLSDDELLAGKKGDGA